MRWRRSSRTSGEPYVSWTIALMGPSSPTVPYQQEADQAEEEDAGERVGGGREERVAVPAVGEVTVEQERRDEGAADGVHEHAGPDRAGSESQLAEDDGGGEDTGEEEGDEERPGERGGGAEVVSVQEVDVEGQVPERVG